MVFGSYLHRFNKPPEHQTSTPYSHQYDLEDRSTVYSEDMDVSVHSLSTVVLTPHIGTEVYSPTTSPNNLLGYRRNSQKEVSDCDIEAQPKRELCSPPMSPRRYMWTEVKIEPCQGMEGRYDEEICTNSSVVVKEETVDSIKVKRELPSPCALAFETSQAIISKYKDVKNEKDDNYNYVPINSFQLIQDS